MNTPNLRAYRPVPQHPSAIHTRMLADMADKDIDAWDAAASAVDESNQEVFHNNQQFIKRFVRDIQACGVKTHNGDDYTDHVKQAISDIYDAADVPMTPCPLPCHEQLFAALGFPTVPNRPKTLREYVDRLRAERAERDTKHWLEVGQQQGRDLRAFPTIAAYIKTVRDYDRDMFVVRYRERNQTCPLCTRLGLPHARMCPTCKTRSGPGEAVWDSTNLCWVMTFAPR